MRHPSRKMAGELRYPVEALFTGSSLGNLYTFARLSARTDLLGLWSASDNQYYVGEWTVRILAEGVPLEPIETVFREAGQSTILTHADVVAEQVFFLPVSPDGNPAATDQRMACFLIRFSNGRQHAVEAIVRHTVMFPAVATDRFTKQPPEDQRNKNFRIHRHGRFCTVLTDQRPAESRVFGSEIPWSACSVDSSTVEAEYVITLTPGERRDLSFVMTYSPQGTDDALKAFKRSRPGRELLTRTGETVNDGLSRARIFTPNAAVNGGMHWAKVNMMRVRHRFRTGEAFTNDPPQDVVVLRDLAWFVLGCDYFHPLFSRRLLDGAVRYGVHDEGKITEYYHADERIPEQHDYHLNINDDTPLVIWALAHHCRTTGDESLAGEFYPVMKKGCEWILKQVRDGLVRCSAHGTNVWGICSWRNIIDDYSLSGAVTEINAECFLALRETAELANHLGRHADGDRFSAAADALRSQINDQLRSERTGLYLLHIDNDGIRHHDVTGDLIFPVLAGVADLEMESRILERLTRPDMWTDHGVRTVSSAETGFDAEAGYELLGGVWPNLTAWVAYCLRKFRPEMLEEALMNICRGAWSERPADYAFVVPGEFPERLHGTSYESRGMTLSPWVPPTYFWLGVEGLLGLHCEWDAVRLTPSIPASWRWIAARDLPVQGRALTAFLYEDTLYASEQVRSEHPVYVGTQLRTAGYPDSIFTAGLLVGGECVVFAATEESVEGIVRWEHNGAWAERATSLSAGEAVLFRVPSEKVAA